MPRKRSPRRLRPDAVDLAVWDSIKDSNRSEELAAYLERHPEGHFAGLARARLVCSGEEATAEAGEQVDKAIELAFWDGVRDAQDPALLAVYLDKYPNGEFALIARARLETLTSQGKASERDERRRPAEPDG